MTAPRTWSIRAGRSEDAEQLSELGERTFRQTYAAETRPDDMDAFLADAFRLDALRAELASSGHHWLLAEVDGTLAGFAHLRDDERHEAIAGRSPVLLAHLYLDQAHQGIGLGSALMDRSLAVARADGHDVIWLGVFERNPKAIAFYRRWRFMEVGSVAFQFGSERQRDLVMGRAV